MRLPTPSETRAHRRYRAFMSYSHQDARWAAWLHRKLEAYRVPRRLRRTEGEYGPIPERLHPIFRDRDELASSSVLGERLRDALADSDALIVVCSPDAAGSRWVNAEIESFKALGRGDRIYCLIVDGEPNAGDARECFPPALRRAEDADADTASMEPIAADLRPGGDGRRLALLKIIAGLIGTDLDRLRNREAQRHHRRMLGAVAASLSGMVLALGLAAIALIARNDAQRRQQQAQDLIVYMLGNLHDKLEKVGRLDLLDSLSGKAIDYLKHLNPRDLNDTALKQLAQAETQLGQVRLDQGRYADALARFRVAYERTRALAQRHPGDSSLLFERGQAEYWIGAVYITSFQMDRARTWFTRYRDTTRVVYASDPTRTDWQHELAYGDYDLAGVELALGRLREAQHGFASARRIFAALLARDPTDTQLQFYLADEISWQGSIQEQYGHLDQSEKDMARKVDVLAELVAKNPDDPVWKLRWSTAQLQQASVLLALGRHASSLALVDATIKRMKALVAHDPGNKDWSGVYLNALIQRAALRFGTGDVSNARADLVLAAPLIRASRERAASDRYIYRYIQFTRQLELFMALRAGDLSSARKTSAALMSSQLSGDTAMPLQDIGRKALSDVLAGMVDRAEGRHADALAHFEAARHLLRPIAQTSTYWRILDPWIRASVLAGHAADSRRARAVLARAGYVPLYPWPQAPTPISKSVSATVTGKPRSSVSRSPSRSPARAGEREHTLPPA